MKTIIPRLLVLLIAILFFGCSKDSTPCVPISCLNGGTSKPECGCNCPQGFTGSNCSTQITPTKITISKIRVKYFSNKTPSQGNWDIIGLNATNASPDISLTMLNSSFAEIYRSTTYYKNAISDSINYFDFVPSTPINITAVNSPFILHLWDYDGADSNINDGIDDDMGFVGLYVYSSTGGFPSTITVSDATIPLSFELTLSYTW